MNLDALAACRPDNFEHRYRDQSDPWSFESSSYETARYAQTLQSLSRARYRRAFEPGCSIGVLTAQLATRCDEVIATDVSETALARARTRCAAFPGVRFLNHDISASPLEGAFDLIVLSEIGYYFTRERLAAVARRLAAQLEPGSEFIAVHWLGESPDHVLHADEVHAVLEANLRLSPAYAARHAGFRIEGWIRA